MGKREKKRKTKEKGMFFLEGASRELLLPFKVNPHQLKSFRLEILNTFLFLSFFFEK